MNIINKVKLHNGANSAETSNVISNINGSQFFIEVDGNVSGLSLVVEGTTTDKEDANWYRLAAINTIDYSVSDSITGKGIYVIGVDGISYIRTKINSISGSATVIGTLGE